MRYTIVIPTYNNCEKYLKPCIDSIIKYTDMDEVELVISANGCTDNTDVYLEYLHTAIPHLHVIWNASPIGFPWAVNEGVEVARADKIVILNNDTVLLEQPKNRWLERLDVGDVCGVLTKHSPITQSRFAVFFCVMISRKVFDVVGLLNRVYGTGGCEDIEFCHLAEKAGFSINDCGAAGDFPIYHAAEGTMHDSELVQDWDAKFLANELTLAKKFNMDWYRWRLSNNYERAVFLKGDEVFSRETARYRWASQHLLGDSVFEIGCSTGYGRQFLPDHIQYAGMDYDKVIVTVAANQWWPNATFFYGDINEMELGQFDTIIAFEVIEHLDNGLELVDRLKRHCKRLLITVPLNEPKGFWGEHHKLHGLNESHFPGFKFNYINEHGEIKDAPDPINAWNSCNLMICWCDNE